MPRLASVRELGTVRGRTTNQSTTTDTIEQASMTSPIGAADATPSNPTTGEISPASPKFSAPDNDAAVPAS
jgi:hypothetical protein